MNHVASIRRTRRNQQGYALMIVLFFLALLTLATIAATPNAITEGQREKEEEMVWRGKQYVRGIRLFYQKTHRFPTQLEDLYKPKTGIRFMRQAFTDPMNPTDGSWRLIYVGPNGQLIGSLKNRTVNAGGVATQQFGSAASSSGFGSPAGNQSTFGNSSFGNSSFGNSGSNSSFGNSSFGSNSSFGGSSSFGSGSNSAQNTLNSTNNTDPNAQNGDQMSTPQSLTPSDDSSASNVVGGNIIGVGSKINKASFMWYEKAKNYRQFEFIWDPSVDSITGRSSGVPPPNASPFGSTPNGSTPNSPFSSGTPNTNGGQNPNSPMSPPLQAPPQ